MRAHQRALGHPGLDADPLRPLRRLPPLGGGAAPGRRVAREPDQRRPQPGGQGGPAGERPRRHAPALAPRPASGTSSATWLGVHPYDVSGTADALHRSPHGPPEAGPPRPASSRRAAARTPAGLARRSARRRRLSRDPGPQPPSRAPSGRRERAPVGPVDGEVGRRESGASSSERTTTFTECAPRPASLSRAAKAGRSPTSSPRKHTLSSPSASSARRCPCRWRRAGAARSTSWPVRSSSPERAAWPSAHARPRRRPRGARGSAGSPTGPCARRPCRRGRHRLRPPRRRRRPRARRPPSGSSRRSPPTTDCRP